MRLQTEPFSSQTLRWPADGRHILAHQDESSVYVYQAYRPAIAQFALENQRFGGEFSYSRMSWIKPNFLWMMFRCGWGTKEGQERILAIRIRKAFFDDILEASIPSTYDPDRFNSREEWQAKGSIAEVRLQWDPDHDPWGAPLLRKAIQLGLRGSMLRRFGMEEPLGIEDMTEFVRQQAGVLKNTPAELLLPREEAFLPSNHETSRWIGLDEILAAKPNPSSS